MVNVCLDYAALGSEGLTVEDFPSGRGRPWIPASRREEIFFRKRIGYDNPV